MSEEAKSIETTCSTRGRVGSDRKVEAFVEWVFGRVGSNALGSLVEHTEKV